MFDISQVFRAVAEVFGWARQREAEKNTPEIQAAARASQAQTQKDAMTKAVADRNVQQVRKYLAE